MELQPLTHCNQTPLPLLSADAPFSNLRKSSDSMSARWERSSLGMASQDFGHYSSPDLTSALPPTAHTPFLPRIHTGTMDQIEDSGDKDVQLEPATALTPDSSHIISTASPCLPSSHTLYTTSSSIYLYPSFSKLLVSSSSSYSRGIHSRGYLETDVRQLEDTGCKSEPDGSVGIKDDEESQARSPREESFCR
ncbi:hypothetical protein EYF80_017645 [Liparis tanakae]|uniref:Uncharacterized protein n=1 Tax=Liparis tanakae TaxID=230148 RepID=A0A4Z2I2A5_9TELE|nr:hypothetical protein EYF80_017645 [Liparis tanakae]